MFASAMLALIAASAGCLEQADATDEPDEASQASDVDITPLPPPILLQTCLTQTADATMTLGKQPDGTYFSHVVSTGTDYTTGVCPYFVVDVIVPGSYTVGGPIVENAFTLSGQINDLTLTQATCPNATETLKIYKRTHNFIGNSTTAFSLIDNESAVGVWHPSPDIGASAYCGLTGAPRYTSSGSLFTTDTYRVMLQPLYNGAPRQARVNWSWAY